MKLHRLKLCKGGHSRSQRSEGFFSPEIDSEESISPSRTFSLFAVEERKQRSTCSNVLLDRILIVEDLNCY